MPPVSSLGWASKFANALPSALNVSIELSSPPAFLSAPIRVAGSLLSPPSTFTPLLLITTRPRLRAESSEFARYLISSFRPEA